MLYSSVNPLSFLVWLQLQGWVPWVWDVGGAAAGRSQAPLCPRFLRRGVGGASGWGAGREGYWDVLPPWAGVFV